MPSTATARPAPSPEVTSRFTQGVDALKRVGLTDEWQILRLCARARAAQVGFAVNAITGLGAADQQAFASALQTINTVRAWSPAIHRCFPADERKVSKNFYKTLTTPEHFLII